jgi:methyl halide transferase
MNDPLREKLRQHFLSGNNPDQWEKAWVEKITLWDRGFPNPALVDLLSTRRDLLGDSLIQSDGQTRRKKALVPGCGKGYDVMLFASFGYDAVGLDGSQTAIEKAKELALEETDKYPLQPGIESRGDVTFVVGDFFKNDWVKGSSESDSKFDVIYDYTVRFSNCGSSKANLTLVSLCFTARDQIKVGTPNVQPSQQFWTFDLP